MVEESKGDFRYPGVIDVLRRKMAEAELHNNSLIVAVHGITSIVDRGLPIPAAEEMKPASQSHAVRDALRPHVLDHLEPWTPELKNDIVNFLTTEYGQGLREWISDTMRRKTDSPRVAEMKQLVSEKLSVPIGGTKTWSGW